MNIELLKLLAVVGGSLVGGIIGIVIVRFILLPIMVLLDEL